MKEGLISIYTLNFAFLVFAVIGGDTFDIGKEAEKLIEECEVTLPQNKTCKLVAVSVEESNK